MEEILEALSIYSVILPLLTGLVLWKFNDANARIMIILLVFASFSQIWGKYLPIERNVRYNLYTIADAFFWALLFFRNTIGIRCRFIVLILYTSLLSYALFSYFSFGVTNKFFSEVVCMNNMIQVICVLIYFYERYYYERVTRLADEPMFWFCIGILLYAPCTYFLFVYRSVDGTVPDSLWNYHHILNTLLYIVITTGFLVRVKRINLLLKWI